MILYEYPFNERIRTLLRLEDLFERFIFFLSQQEAKSHHIALITLFEITEVSCRIDLKADLIKELERQRQTFTLFLNNPKIEQTKLENVLNNVENTLNGLNQIQGKIGQHLVENEWLSSIRSRAVIPGGTCKFDLPAYYAWQHHPFEQRRNDILKWIKPFWPLHNAVKIVLELTRESGIPTKVIAIQGSYQQMLSGKNYQLMQIKIFNNPSIIPETSANKYMLWIRFKHQDDGNIRPRLAEDDISFQLTLCNL